MILLRPCILLTLLLRIESASRRNRARPLRHLYHIPNETLNTIVSDCNAPTSRLSNFHRSLPKNWPCSWRLHKIPYVFDFFSPSPKRMMGRVKRGLKFLEDRSCLAFEEKNPIEAAHQPNYTYLFYTFSGVTEDCCLDYFSEPVGKRLVLLTPLCTMPPQVAHVTLHALGLTHPPNGSFTEDLVKAALFHFECKGWNDKYTQFLFNKHWNIVAKNYGDIKKSFSQIAEIAAKEARENGFYKKTSPNQID